MNLDHGAQFKEIQNQDAQITQGPVPSSGPRCLLHSLQLDSKPRYLARAMNATKSLSEISPLPFPLTTRYLEHGAKAIYAQKECTK